MQIAIIGAGKIGTALGLKWAAAGHTIFFGVRDINSPKLETLKNELSGSSSVVTVKEACSKADVIVLSVPFAAVKETVENVGDISQKIIIDTTNPISVPVPTGFTSGAEALASWSKSKKVVKAFNSTGVDNLKNPAYKEGAIETFICGDDADAKKVTAKLAEEIGFSVADAGPLAAASQLEHLAKLWVNLAYQQGFGPSFAFKIVKR